MVVLRLENVEELATNHEEANIKMFFSFITRIGARMEKKSHALWDHVSGIDMLIILLANENPNLHVYMNSGASKSIKLLNLMVCNLTRIQKQALLGLHAFTWNDYT